MVDVCAMDGKWEYVSLSKRFESFATRAADPNLAAAYRSLAQHYRTLDRWRQRIISKYESTDGAPESGDPPDLGAAAPPPRGRS
jgi:hypothetical protein